VLREAARRAIAGERLASVARDLRSRGIPSPTGHVWTDATLGRLLRNPRLVGDRAYKGQVESAWDPWRLRTLEVRMEHGTAPVAEAVSV
jgi:hypothetical protein